MRSACATEQKSKLRFCIKSSTRRKKASSKIKYTCDKVGVCHRADIEAEI
jgi:hypothetical protein